MTYLWSLWWTWPCGSQREGVAARQCCECRGPHTWTGSLAGLCRKLWLTLKWCRTRWKIWSRVFADQCLHMRRNAAHKQDHQDQENKMPKCRIQLFLNIGLIFTYFDVLMTNWSRRRPPPAAVLLLRATLTTKKYVFATDRLRFLFQVSLIMDRIPSLVKA